MGLTFAAALSTCAHAAATSLRWAAIFCLVLGTSSRLTGATFTVNKTTDFGSGTLRDAIERANALPGQHIIVFSLSGGAGVKTISPLTPLPVIINPVTIDGWSQGGAGYSGPPLIELDGSAISFPFPRNGLEFWSGFNTVRGLIINRFALAGIALVTNGFNTIQGNYIGTDSTGTQARGNTNQGIVIVNSRNNTIGGTTAATRNIISGNRFGGIQLLNSGAHHNLIQGNYIGLDVNGTTALPNLHGGIVLNALAGTSNDYPTDNLIGGSEPGQRNVISGNEEAGIWIGAIEAGTVTGPTRNEVIGNYIGTDKNGTAARPNIGAGILLTNATGNVIGGTSAEERNVISGNITDGIIIEAGRSNIIQGNWIGTDATGLAPLGNLLGVAIHGGSGNVIGDTVPGRQNVISGNTLDGIELKFGTTSNRVVRNFIGLSENGLAFLPNGQHGVALFDASHNTIGTPELSENYGHNFIVANGGNGVFLGRGALNRGSLSNRVEGNLIATNGLDGVQLSGGANGNQILGNVIGGATGFGGTTLRGNGRHGVAIFDSMNNVIGVRNSDLTRNNISGNRSNGIFMGKGGLASGSFSNTVRGNGIGNNAMGNGAAGIFVQGSGNTIGGQDVYEGNRIGYNGSNLMQRGHGVVIESGTNNAIFGNLFHRNAGRGIDLGNDSFTVNDLNDRDTGPNELQNYPVVTRVAFDPVAGVKEITWTLNSRSNRFYDIEFFGNSEPDPSGFGEGERYLGTMVAVTDDKGIAVFTKTFPLSDNFISATATDSIRRDTSEFSPVDTDGDAIADAWEYGGIDFNEDGTNDLQLLGNYLHKDIYVEIDAMTGRAPDFENLSRVSLGTGGGDDGFLYAPKDLVQNPDGEEGIFMHLEIDETDLPFAEHWGKNYFTSFDLLKKDHFGTIAQRSNPSAIMAKQLVYRYCIFANNATNAGGATRAVGANDFFVARGDGSSSPHDVNVASDFMHELGHSLGIHHGGTDGQAIVNFNNNYAINYKPNYHSVVNYTWVHASGRNTAWRLDYSREEFTALNEAKLVEPVGIGASVAHFGHLVKMGPHLDGTTRLDVFYVPEVGPVDWNRNGNSMDLDVARDINYLSGTNPSPGQVLLPSEDWSKLRYYFLDNPHTTLKAESSSFSLSSFAANDSSSGLITNDLDPSELEAFDKLGTKTGLIEFAQTRYTLNETASVAVITVTRLYETEGAVSVSFSTVSGTATSGMDYITTNGVLNFAGTETVKTFSVPIVNDTFAEHPETILLRLSNPTGGATIGYPGEAILTIIDNDPPVRFTVINTNNSGAGSLQQAILDANSATGVAIIDFNIPATSGLTISLASSLDGITRPVTIDGTTQPGFAGVPIIELSGASLFNFDGLHISGGGCTVRGLVINGFRGNGIKLVSGGGNRIEGCYIGLNRLGTLDQGNAFAGIHVDSANNVIGGTNAAARNYISGNNSGGIQLGFGTVDFPATNNQVVGNVIGLGVDGSVQGNSSVGIAITGSRNIVGGTEAGARNVISGNGNAGVNIAAGIESRVLGNYIGTDLTGTIGRGNGGIGVDVNNAHRHIIGGNEPGAGNVISSNGGWGISLNGTNSIVLGNRIGTDATGQSALPNRSGGITLVGLNHQIGDTTQFGANIIAFNNGRGVAVPFVFSVNNTIRGNSIFANSSNSPFPDFSLGIDLGTQGVTENDTNDIDVGLQNFPLLTSASNSLSGTVITGSVKSQPNTNFTIDFYASAAADPSGFGEGQTWIGSTNVMTDGNGNATFIASSPAIYLKGRFITATATDAAGNTSEFSRAIFAESSITGRKFTVENVNDSGSGSLRQAILDANAFTGNERDTIEFSIPGFGVQTIRPLSPLPAITDPVLIDGYTQPGASPNTSLTGHNGVLLIELDGSLAGITYGLRIRGGDSIVRGLVINRFGTGAALFDQVGGIEISAIHGNRIEGNLIGLDPTGALGRGNFTEGIRINGSSNHVIGGLSPAQRNVISGTKPIISGGSLRLGNGISLGNDTAGNRIEGNLIGTTADAVTPLGNGGFGLGYNGGGAATNTVIGGTQPGSGNVIAFNGLLLSDNSFQGGGIQDPANMGGSPILGNSIHSNQGMGIQGDLINSPQGSRNFPFLSSVISSNGLTTIQGRLHSVSNALHRVEFFANDTFDPSSHGEGQFFLGATNVPTDSNGFVAFTAVLPVAVSNGMFLTATATDDRNNTSEFSPRLTMGDVLTNLIVVNSIDEVDDGVANTNHTSLREAIVAANNHPGPDLIRFAIGSGPRTIAVSNSQPAIMDAGTTLDATTQPGFAGQPLIYLDGLSRVPTGFRLYSPSNTIRGFAINRFGTGIYGDGTFCSPSGGFNIIEGNYVGVDRTGGSPGFQTRGITFLFPGCSSNRIGGTSVAARNVISGNTANTGVGVTIGQSAGNTIQGNFVGTGLTGSNVVFNRHGIILSGGIGSTIGGSTPGAGNIISGNNERQIYLAGCPGSVVQGNFIGTDVLGRTHLANCITALGVESDGILIRSNLISGPTTTGGLYLGGSSNRVEGNFIGTDAAGTNKIQSNAGVMIFGRSNVIGGTNAASRNLIAGGSHGVIIQGQANVVQGNFIGTKIDGLSPLGHFFEGVIVQGSLNQIGGVGAGMGNTIAFNGGAGISVSAGTDNAVLGNSIFSNTGLGIDLGTVGVTTNDLGDVDLGPNNLQNFPLLSAARNISVGTLFDGSLNSRGNTSFHIEFFSNTDCHPSGHGQGRTFLNSTTVTTDSAGNATIFVNHPVPIPAGRIITATATDPNGNTSEFSPCVTVINDTNYVELAIGRSGNAHIISWPTNASNFQLEQSTNLSPPVIWQVVSNGIATNGAFRNFTLTNDPAFPTRFFRLTRP